MQWRRIGLLFWPRSKRLLNDIHDNPARHAVRLHDMQARLQCGSRHRWQLC